LLEEMVDYGWPLTTEPNALTDLIRPPTVMAKVRYSIFIVICCICNIYYLKASLLIIFINRFNKQ